MTFDGAWLDDVFGVAAGGVILVTILGGVVAGLVCVKHLGAALMDLVRGR